MSESWYDKNKERLNARARARYQLNKEARQAQIKAWSVANKEKLQAYQQRYYQENRQAVLHRMSVADQTPHRRYSVLKSTAKKRGITVGITEAEYTALLRENSICTYCGGIIDVKKGSGLDRLDPSQGYITGNIAPCCRLCNNAKGTMSLSTFESWLCALLARYDVWTNKS